MRNASYSAEGGSLLDNPTTGEASQTQLNHEEISWEYYSGHVFTTLGMVPVVERHHGTTLQMRAIGSQFNWTLSQEVEVVLLAILLEKVCDRNTAGLCSSTEQTRMAVCT